MVSRWPLSTIMPGEEGAVGSGVIEALEFAVAEGARNGLVFCWLEECGEALVERDGWYRGESSVTLPSCWGRASWGGWFRTCCCKGCFTGA